MSVKKIQMRNNKACIARLLFSIFESGIVELADSLKYHSKLSKFSRMNSVKCEIQ